MVGYTVTKESIFLGKIEVSNGGIVCYECTPEFQQFINENKDTVITRLEDIHMGDKIVMVEKKVDKNDLLYPLAFGEWLERHGYDVVTLHPEVDEEIMRVLDLLPGHEEVKKNIHSILPNATYLEKTYLLENLYKSINR